MVKFHPDTRFLTDYAAGSLPESQALCVAAHLHYCSSCRARVSELNQLGAELFMGQVPADVSESSFDRVMARLDAAPSEATTAKEKSNTGETASPPLSRLPRAIHKLTGGNIETLNWKKIGKTFRFSSIDVGDRQRETSLLHFKAGGSVPRHNHRGDEITVVLKGSFSDMEGHYHVGDYIVRTRGESHTPVAAQDEDCLCLTTLDAPIVMHNWIYRLLMPFLNRATR